MHANRRRLRMACHRLHCYIVVCCEWTSADKQTHIIILLYLPSPSPLICCFTPNPANRTVQSNDYLWIMSLLTPTALHPLHVASIACNTDASLYTTRCNRRRQTTRSVPPLGELDETCASYVAWSVCTSVCLYLCGGYTGELYKNS